MLIKLKPTTPGLRGTVLVYKKELSSHKPYKTLTTKIKSTGIAIPLSSYFIS